MKLFLIISSSIFSIISGILIHPVCLYFVLGIPLYFVGKIFLKIEVKFLTWLFRIISTVIISISFVLFNFPILIAFIWLLIEVLTFIYILVESLVKLLMFFFIISAFIKGTIKVEADRQYAKGNKFCARFLYKASN